MYFFNRYRHLLRPAKHDTSKYGFEMLKGYLLLDCKRTYANIDRKINGEDHKGGQNLQQYMSDSPWDSAAVFKQVQEDIQSRSFLGGGTLNFDETGEECSGPKKAGAARQYIGRSGKVDMGQVVVLGSFYRDGHWLLTDAELFLPKQWFEAPLKKEWKRLHIPSERRFKSKVEIARELFLRAVTQGLPFDEVGFDSLYGRDLSFRLLIGEYGKHYMACIPSDTQVWLSDPSQEADARRALVKDIVKDLPFAVFKSRDAERGALEHEHAFLPVWSMQKVPKSEISPLGYTFHPETLVIRKEHDGATSFALSDYNIEQDCKSVRKRSSQMSSQTFKNYRIFLLPMSKNF